MLDIEIDRATVEDLEKEAHDQSVGYRQETEDGSLCQDLNQHSDEYRNRYYNYKPVKIEGIATYPARPNDTQPSL